MTFGAKADELGRSLRGQLIRPGDDAYEQARRVWNAMIDKRPALIARCAGVSDAVSAVNFARDHHLLIAVRGGGHNVAGTATCDDGMVIDLSLMKGARVDPRRQTARAEAGLTWGEYDQETQVFGLATPGGVISTTGIAGLTLGGGVGWLSPSYGAACDNVLSADVVTARGEVLTASPEDNPDLYWGIRGGGGNFGVVTSFEYRLHAVRELLAGLVIHPRSEARGFLQAYSDLRANAPDQLASFAALLSSSDGDPLVVVFVAYNGDAGMGARVLEPLRRFGSPLVDDIASKPYRVVQTALDAGFPAGKRHYWKSSALTRLDPALLDILIEHANRAPSPLSAVGIENQLGGAVARVPPGENAFGLRQTEHNLGILAIWEDPADDEINIRWARDLWTAVQPFSTGSVYVNYLGWDEADRIGEAYGSQIHQRLVELKTRYDPENLFRLNQNIVPAVHGPRAS
jgi:hypothetical protein